MENRLVAPNLQLNEMHFMRLLGRLTYGKKQIHSKNIDSVCVLFGYDEGFFSPVPVVQIKCSKRKRTSLNGW